MVKKYLHSPKPGYLYVRIRGNYLGRLTAPVNTPDFDRQYWDIRRGKNTCKTTWAALIFSYRRSDRWTGLKARTRSDYEKVLVYIEETNGSNDCTRLIRRDVIAAMEANQHRIRFANYIPQIMSVLCEHAIDLGWMADNSAKGVRRLKTPREKRQTHIPWPDWAVDKWRSEASSLPNLIFEIGVGSVQRPGDWGKFRWNDYDGDTLCVAQGKTDKPMQLPCTRALREALDGAPKQGLTILTLRDGRPMPYRRMADIMRKERDRLDLLAYDLHALRYRGDMELALAGCDDDEIAAYSGHASKEMIRKYAGEARQVMRARQAREKRR